MIEQKKILIVEDELIVARDIQQTLLEEGYKIVGIANSYITGFNLFMEFSPDLLICDIKLKTHQSGVELVRKVHNIKRVPVIFITAYSDEETLSEAFETEPDSYLTKPFTDEQLLVSVSRIFKCRNIKENGNGKGGPTAREKEIIAHIAIGCSSKDIADRLCISFETVQSHRKNIFKKYNVSSSAELITLAHTNNWLN